MMQKANVSHGMTNMDKMVRGWRNFPFLSVCSPNIDHTITSEHAFLRSATDKPQSPLVSDNDLAPASCVALSALSKVASQLGLENTSWSGYQTSLTRGIMDVMDLELEHQDLDELAWTISKQRRSAEQELVGLKELLENLQRQRVEKDEKDIETWRALTVKSEPLTEVKTVEGMTSLRRLEQVTNDHENQLDKVKKQLEQYHDLPCDVQLGSVKVQEKKAAMVK
ncbi:hypothetical protein [Absidia glauca]|uniref:Uncharacterized protein n=1 Tax=Absidia glauca TaxID=4829 RepID=A0A163KVH0_ABSGL|nr:hypothetical protein [Absidia glauca]